jgi:DNA-binding NtrC family response regulator
MTGYPSLATAQQSLELGLLDYLVKPFDDIRVVREKVRAALAAPVMAPANPTSRRIDVYEDNAQHARAIAEALTHLNVEPHLVLQALPGGPELPAAIVLSWDFSEAHGVKGLELVRRIAPGVPFVVLAEHLTMETAIESLRGGATACLPKLLNDPKAMGRELQRALKLPAFGAAE